MIMYWCWSSKGFMKFSPYNSYQIFSVCASGVRYDVMHLPPGIEHVPLHSNSLCKNMARVSGGANNMHRLSWGYHKRKRSQLSYRTRHLPTPPRIYLLLPPSPHVPTPPSTYTPHLPTCSPIYLPPPPPNYLSPRHLPTLAPTYLPPPSTYLPLQHSHCPPSSTCRFEPPSQLSFETLPPPPQTFPPSSNTHTHTHSGQPPC